MEIEFFSTGDYYEVCRTIQYITTYLDLLILHVTLKYLYKNNNIMLIRRIKTFFCYQKSKRNKQ